MKPTQRAAAIATVIAVAHRCAAAGAASSPPALAFRPEADAGLPGVSQWLVAVLVCALALALAIGFLRRRGHTLPWGAQPGRLITVLERQAVTPQLTLIATQYGNRRLLIAVGPTAIQCLRDEPLHAAGTEPVGPA